MKLTEEQIKNISINYKSPADALGGEWNDGYKSGIRDTLMDLGYCRDEIVKLLQSIE